MKKVNLSFKMTAAMVLAAAISVSSCMDLGLDPNNINNTSFGQMVGGNVDPEQDWNLAQQASVSVTVPTESTVRVYAFDGRNYRIVASKKISGTQNILFDVIDGYDDLIVVNFNNGAIKKTKVGGSVDFNEVASKSVINAGNQKVTASLDDNYKQFNYQTVLNDIYSDLSLINATATRPQGMTAPFKDLENSVSLYYSESGTFTLNPVWYTNESGPSATIGIYYYDNGQRVEVPIFTNDKSNDMLQYQTDGWGYSSWQTYSDAHMPSLNNYGLGSSFDFHSKGIVINVPAKTAFGFYIIAGYDNHLCTHYSESSITEVPQWGYNENGGPEAGKHWIGDDLGHYGHVAVINIKDGNGTRNYLGFDDWYEGNAHQYYYPEYDHLVFSYSGDLAPVGGGFDDGDDDDDDDDEGGVIDEPICWSLACEDLGESADYDFNDVVLQIKHTAGETKAYCTLLASGGTLYNKIYFGDKFCGEVHELFDVDVTVMVNTQAVGEEKIPVSFEVDVPEDFTMSDADMGGFVIMRFSEDGKVYVGEVAAPKKGQTPYMICVPSNWKWPWEMTNITEAYPEFSTWCSDHTQAKDWFLNCVGEKVYKSSEHTPALDN